MKIISGERKLTYRASTLWTICLPFNETPNRHWDKIEPDCVPVNESYQVSFTESSKISAWFLYVIKSYQKNLRLTYYRRMKAKLWCWCQTQPWLQVVIFRRMCNSLKIPTTIPLKPDPATLFYYKCHSSDSLIEYLNYTRSLLNTV